eukprot:2405634-Rhodomonas_salina.1
MTPLGCKWVANSGGMFSPPSAVLVDALSTPLQVAGSKILHRSGDMIQSPQFPCPRRKPLFEMLSTVPPALDPKKIPQLQTQSMRAVCDIVNTTFRSSLGIPPPSIHPGGIELWCEFGWCEFGWCEFGWCEFGFFLDLFGASLDAPILSRFVADATATDDLVQLTLNLLLVVVP